MSSKSQLAKWNNRCAYCDTPLVAGVSRKDPRYSTKDHFFPRASGAIGLVNNTVPCCAPCNVAKAALDPRRLLWVWVRLDPVGLLDTLTTYLADRDATAPPALRPDNKPPTTEVP